MRLVVSQQGHSNLNTDTLIESVTDKHTKHFTQMVVVKIGGQSRMYNVCIHTLNTMSGPSRKKRSTVEIDHVLYTEHMCSSINAELSIHT